MTERRSTVRRSPSGTRSDGAGERAIMRDMVLIEVAIVPCGFIRNPEERPDFLFVGELLSLSGNESQDIPTRKCFES
jgi:hypothetical protein